MTECVDFLLFYKYRFTTVSITMQAVCKTFFGTGGFGDNGLMSMAQSLGLIGNFHITADGTGVGGGIILDGKILTGTTGGAGEIGHMPVGLNETECCGCGNKGCLEQYASATGIVKVAKKILAECDTETPLRNMEGFSAKDVMDLAKAGDQVAIDVIEQLGDYLGKALAHIACVVNPSAFVIGGGVSKAGEMLFDYIRPHYEKYVFHGSKNTKFALATLGNDAGIVGAARLVLEQD